MLIRYTNFTAMRGEEQGSKSPFSLPSEPISPSSLLFISSSRSIQINSPHSQLFFSSLLPTFSLHFSLLPTFFGPFLPPLFLPPLPWTKFKRKILPIKKCDEALWIWMWKFCTLVNFNWVNSWKTILLEILVSATVVFMWLMSPPLQGIESLPMVFPQMSNQLTAKFHKYHCLG